MPDSLGKFSQERGPQSRVGGGQWGRTDSSFLCTQICTYFHQHKIQQDRMSHRCSSPDGDRTRGGRTGTGLGSCPNRSHTPCSTGDSVLLLCPQSSPEGTRSRTSCGDRSHRGHFPPDPTTALQVCGLLGPAKAERLAGEEILAVPPSPKSAKLGEKQRPWGEG